MSSKSLRDKVLDLLIDAINDKKIEINGPHPNGKWIQKSISNDTIDALVTLIEGEVRAGRIDELTKLNSLVTAKEFHLSSKHRAYGYISQRKLELSIPPQYDLQYCEQCNQMTNHLNGVCQKCKQE
jgi:hypothetical protein